jgi:protein-disulfide isomerase
MVNAPALGSADARVTIVEFGDYQCTWCHRWHQSTKDAVIADYVDTGKVRFLFKDFPINDLSDRASSLAAEASYCAADQGKYWDYHDELYDNWEGENTGWVTKSSLRQFASDIGLDEQQFSECLDSGRHNDLVRANYNLAAAAGLSATPSFIVLVDGEVPKLIRGAHPYTTFQQVIDPFYAD